MHNRYYAPGERRAGRVNDLFATIAPRYDLINDLQSFGLHRLWKRELIRLAAPLAGARALDVCCGTADVALRLAQHGAEVVGLDFSEPMLAVAQRRLADGTTLNRVWFLRGDALHLPFADEMFDVVTISYGLRNLSDLDAGLRELLRVIRPGGRLLVLDFGKPDNRAWRACYFAYLRAGVPLFGRFFCGDAQTHGYILASLRDYPAQHGVAAALQRFGCREVLLKTFLGGIMTIHRAAK